MRLKHWSGYGYVDAKKVATGKTMDNYGYIYSTVSVRVTGDHERGLTPFFHDDTLVEHWLFRRFYKGNGKFHGYSEIMQNSNACTFIIEYEEV